MSARNTRTGNGQHPDYLTHFVDGRRREVAGLELAAANVERFNRVLQAVCPSLAPVSVDQIVTAARQVLSGVPLGEEPAFIATRLARLESLATIVDDADWGLAANHVASARSLLGYVDDPHDLIPDALPGIGLLDDAILIDLWLREIGSEAYDYEDFRRVRAEAAQRAGCEPNDLRLSRAAWSETCAMEYAYIVRRRQRRDAELAAGPNYALAQFRVA